MRAFLCWFYCCWVEGFFWGGGGGVEVLHFKTPVNLQLCFILFARFVNVWICGILYHLLLVSLIVFILFVL